MKTLMLIIAILFLAFGSTCCGLSIFSFFTGQFGLGLGLLVASLSGFRAASEAADWWLEMVKAR